MSSIDFISMTLYKPLVKILNSLEETVHRSSSLDTSFKVYIDPLMTALSVSSLAHLSSLSVRMA